MFTELDERKGLVKVDWSIIRNRVFAVEPKFAQLVDALSPDKSFPLYLAYYNFGAIDADTQSSLFPHLEGDYFRISDPNVHPDLITNLGYSKNNTPLGMVLEKQIECFIDFKNKKRTIPWRIYSPGDMFPFTRVFANNKRIYSPNGLLSSCAGSRSSFMLPNIGCETNHMNLQRDFKIKNSAPKSLYDQWYLFKEIIGSKIVQTDWRCCVLYFSHKWLLSLEKEKAWSSLKHYLHELAWYRFEYNINKSYYDMIFSIIQENRNLKPNPYLTDTAKHLFAIAMGAVPGFVPALDDEALPQSILQKIYLDLYNLKKYIPTFMQPKCYKFETDRHPSYYSFHHPSTHVFSPRSRTIVTTLIEMRELEHIMKIFSTELSKPDGLCASDSMLHKIAKEIDFNYFHNKIDKHEIIKPSYEIYKNDDRFRFLSDKAGYEIPPSFAADGAFVRGCISIQKKIT